MSYKSDIDDAWSGVIAIIAVLFTTGVIAIGLGVGVYKFIKWIL